MNTRNSVRRKLTAVLVAILSAISIVSAPQASAANRDWLRPGCTWDPVKYWVQRCNVWSLSLIDI